MTNSPRIVEKLPDGSNLWQKGDQHVVSWSSSYLPESLDERFGGGVCFDSPEAARLAWEINKPTDDYGASVRTHALRKSMSQTLECAAANTLAGLRTYWDGEFVNQRVDFKEIYK